MYYNVALPSLIHLRQDQGDQDINMGEVPIQTTLGPSNPPPSSPPPPIGVDPTLVTLQPGETLVVHHPHSRRPMCVLPTTELHGPKEHSVRHGTEKPENPYTPFPTRTDFEQAEIFINHNCSDKLVNNQLKLACKNGMRLKVKSSREMHKLLANGVGENTDDSKVHFFIYCKMLHPSQDSLQFRQEEITVPYIRGELKEDRTYTVRYRPAMDAMLRLIKDPDLRESFTMYPQQHYIRDPCGGPNMRVWTDLHTANDWWSLQVSSPLPLFTLMITIDPGQDRLGKGRDSHAAILGCHTAKQHGVKEVLGGLDVHRKHPPGASGQSEEEGGCRSPRLYP